MSAIRNRRRSLAALTAVAGWFVSPAIVCFAWLFRIAANDVRMAAALWRRDANRVRGRGCALFYLVTGSNKIAIVGMGMIVPCLFLSAWFGKRPLPIVEAFVGFVVAGIFGCGLVGLTATVAVGYALWNRLRIWIDWNTRPDHVLNGRWPPVFGFKDNGAKWVGALPCLLAMCSAFLLMGYGIVTACVVGILACAVALLVVRTVIARHPWECYPELTDFNDK